MNPEYKQVMHPNWVFMKRCPICHKKCAGWLDIGGTYRQCEACRVWWWC